MKGRARGARGIGGGWLARLMGISAWSAAHFKGAASAQVRGIVEESERCARGVRDEQTLEGSMLFGDRGDPGPKKSRSSLRAVPSALSIFYFEIGKSR